MDILRKLAAVAFDVTKKNIESMIKIHIDDLGIVNIDENNGMGLKLGEVVRDCKHNKFMVVREKTDYKYGLLTSLNLVKKKWYHCLTYCPYSRSVSADGGCRIETEALSRTDGFANTLSIQKMDVYLRNNPESIGGCPAPIHEFPAFDLIQSHSKGVYIPAIEELYDVFRDTNIQSLFRGSLFFKGGVSIRKDSAFKIWSSTDNCSSIGQFGQEAISLLLENNMSLIAQSARKDEDLFVVLFRRY